MINAAVLEAELGLDYLRSKRGRFWLAPEMLNALEAFAERADRR